MDDAKLIQRILKGETECFGQLVSKYQRLIFLSIAKIVQEDRQVVEDLTQECFIAAYQALRHFKGDSSFSTWLVKIAVNKALDYKKKMRQLPIAKEGDWEQVPSGHDPVRALLKGEEKQAVCALLEQLPPSYQRVIIDYYYHELSYQEIASKEAIQVKSVESRLYRARQKLRALWEEGQYDDL